jgi:hypothetical protein
MRTVLEVGDVVLATVTNKYELCCDNSLGGTESMPVGTYRIRITHAWFDYETGDRAKGVLLDEKDIAMVREKFLIKNIPTQYAAGAKVRTEEWNPAEVYGLGTGGAEVTKCG